jgi:hypothetical protein
MQILDGATAPINGQATSTSFIPRWRQDKQPTQPLNKLTTEQGSEPLVSKPTTVYPSEAQPINTPKIDGDESEFAEHKPDVGPEFPADCLPDVLRDLADNVAAATKTPPVISYAAGLSSVAASLGSSLMLETNPGECVAGNLYIIPIVDSGCCYTEARTPRSLRPRDLDRVVLQDHDRSCLR